jgi:hypothetical protein
LRYRPIGKICTRRVALTERGVGDGVSLNLRWEQVLPGRRCGQSIIRGGEAVVGDDQSSLKWRTEEDGVGVWLSDTWRRRRAPVWCGARRGRGPAGDSSPHTVAAMDYGQLVMAHGKQREMRWHLGSVS